MAEAGYTFDLLKATPVADIKDIQWQELKGEFYSKCRDPIETEDVPKRPVSWSS